MAREPYTTGDLATALLQRAGVKRPFFQDPFTTGLSPIMVLVSWIYHLPILHRKAILDACRIQAPIFQNKTLSATFSSLTPVHVIPEDNTDLGIVIIYPQTIASFFEIYTHSPPYAHFFRTLYGLSQLSIKPNSSVKRTSLSTKNSVQLCTTIVPVRSLITQGC